MAENIVKKSIGSGDAPVPMFEILTQYQNLRAEVENAVHQVLESTEYIGGLALKELESDLGAFFKAHAVAVSSGTDAILASLMALGIGRGDKVITTPFTFFATAGCISRAGAQPVFVDIEPATFLIRAAAISAAADSTTRAADPVHLFGQMCEMDALAETGRRQDLIIVEDAAQCIGAADSRGRVPGELGRTACLSFYPTKNLGAAGDAGAVIVRDPVLAHRLEQTRQHGETSRYHHAFVGGNFRLDGIQCAVLRVKLKYLDMWNNRRRQIAAWYSAQFKNTDVVAPVEIPGTHHVYHQYVVRVPRRDAVREHLQKNGIGSAVYYPRPLHLQECFRDLGYQEGAFPVAEQACREVLALPVFPELTDGQIQRVADTLLAYFR
ncbi:MAG: DegT/DnrJ/EryC1/StrS family aminotransferase [Planctomycetia bacterium]|nr:DegT/DnrJ/EryC1/StrS family aminotransferase [Planctomycetia bacterium]